MFNISCNLTPILGVPGFSRKTMEMVNSDWCTASTFFKRIILPCRYREKWYVPVCNNFKPVLWHYTSTVFFSIFQMQETFQKGLKFKNLTSMSFKGKLILTAFSFSLLIFFVGVQSLRNRFRIIHSSI